MKHAAWSTMPQRCHMSFWALRWIHGEQKKKPFFFNPSSRPLTHPLGVATSLRLLAHLISYRAVSLAASILLAPLSPSHNFASGMS